MKKHFVYSLYIYLTIICLFSYSSVCGQHKIPNIGENIKFLPIVKEQRGIKTGYDCFFKEELTCKNGVFIFKKSNRFKIGADKLTPLSEIEEFTFHIRNIQKLEIKGEEVLLIFLTRIEDREKIILRLLLDNGKGDNLLYNAMFGYNKKSDDWNYGYAVERVLPYVNIDSLNAMKERYVGQKVFYTPSDIALELHDVSNFKSLVNLANKKTYYFKSESSFNVEGINFMGVINGFLAEIPCVRLIRYGDLINVPLCFFNNEKSTISYSLSNLFSTEEEFKKQELIKYELKKIYDEYVGKQVYYGLNNRLGYAEEKECWTLFGLEKYYLKEGVYKCDDFMIVASSIGYGSSERNVKYPYAVLEDSLGIKFKVCVKDGFLNETKRNSFEQYFTHQYIADSVLAERNRIRIEEEQIRLKKIQRLEKELGQNFNSFLYECSEDEIERFIKLKNKYGAYDAKMIVQKRFRIGWTEEMVIESLGHPNDVNRSVGSWGVHEQWIYRYKYTYDATYLYFENGRLKSYQE